MNGTDFTQKLIEEANPSHSQFTQKHTHFLRALDWSFGFAARCTPGGFLSFGRSMATGIQSP
jgi:hypothetical protein